MDEPLTTAFFGTAVKNNTFAVIFAAIVTVSSVKHILVQKDARSINKRFVISSPNRPTCVTVAK